MADPKKPELERGITTTEVWTSVAGGVGIYQIAMIEGGPTMPQALCAVALALGFGAYAFARSYRKRTP